MNNPDTDTLIQVRIDQEVLARRQQITVLEDEVMALLRTREILAWSSRVETPVVEALPLPDVSNHEVPQADPELLEIFNRVEGRVEALREITELRGVLLLRDAGEALLASDKKKPGDNLQIVLKRLGVTVSSSRQWTLVRNGGVRSQNVRQCRTSGRPAKPN